MKHPESNKDRIMDYLFGNMSIHEKSEFERTMETNDAVKNEVSEFRSVKDYLDTWKEEEVEIPPLEELVYLPRSEKRSFFIKKWIPAIAAGLLLLLFALAWLSEVQINYEPGRTVISFGSAKTEPPIEVLQVEMEKLLDAYKEQVNDEINSIVPQLEEINQRVLDLAERRTDHALISKIENLERHLATSESVQQRWMNEIMQGYTSSQNRALEEWMVNGLAFLEEQRRRDMAVMEQAFFRWAAAISPNSSTGYVNDLQTYLGRNSE